MCFFCVGNDYIQTNDNDCDKYWQIYTRIDCRMCYVCWMRFITSRVKKRNTLSTVKQRKLWTLINPKRICGLCTVEHTTHCVTTLYRVDRRHRHSSAKCVLWDVAFFSLSLALVRVENKHDFSFISISKINERVIHFRRSLHTNFSNETRQNHWNKNR